MVVEMNSWVKSMAKKARSIVDNNPQQYHCWELPLAYEKFSPTTLDAIRAEILLMDIDEVFEGSPPIIIDSMFPRKVNPLAEVVYLCTTKRL